MLRIIAGIFIIAYLLMFLSVMTAIVLLERLSSGEEK